MSIALDASVELAGEIQDIVQELSDYFDYEDIVKTAFLFGDVLDKSHYQELVSTHSTETNFEKLNVLLPAVLTKREHFSSVNFQADVMAEILFLIKKYSALKKLHTCKHQMKEKFLKEELIFSSEFRRFLLSLCDELTDEDVNYIWLRVNQGSRDVKPVLPEFLFDWMLHSKLIDELDVENLLIHFKVLERDDLLDKINKYKEKIGVFSNLKQYDLSITPGNEYCGLAYIFNFSTFDRIPDRNMFSQEKPIDLQPRRGTDIDAENLKRLWNSFGIKTVTKNNCTKGEFHDILKGLLMSDLTSHKILIINILSHGNDGKVYCSDGLAVQIQAIEDCLGKCKALANKPKLLFIQACQGNLLQDTARSHRNSLAETIEYDGPSDSPLELPMPQYSDMLIGMATVPGYMSIRNISEGTHYIQALVEVLMESGDQEDLSLLLVNVNWRVATKRATLLVNGKQRLLVQMPTIRNQLTRGLRFRRVSSQT